MARAGYRGPQAELTLSGLSSASPIALIGLDTDRRSSISSMNFGFSDEPDHARMAIAIGAAYLGIKLPEIFLSQPDNQAAEVHASRVPGRARSDADLRGIRHVDRALPFRKVSTEIGSSSVPMAEELALTTAELSYLPDRRTAYENLAKRTGLDNIKSVTTVLIQSGALRHAARAGRFACSRRKPRSAHDRRRKRRRHPCRQNSPCR